KTHRICSVHRRVMVASSLPMASQELWEGAPWMKCFAIGLFCLAMVTLACLLYRIDPTPHSIAVQSSRSSIQGGDFHEQERTSGASYTQGQLPSSGTADGRSAEGRCPWV